MKEKQKRLNIWSSTFSVVLFISLVIGMYFVGVDLLQRINSGEINNNDFILFVVLSIILLSIFATISILVNIILWRNDVSNGSIGIASSVITLNIFAIIIFVKQKNNKEEFWKFSKWNILDIIMIAITISLYAVIDFATSWIPPLPFFITVSFKFIPLFFLAYISDFFKTLTAGFISSIIAWVIPNNMDSWNFLAFIFDYAVPLMVVAIAALFKPSDIKSKLIYSLGWFVFITIPFILIWFSRSIAGIIWITSGYSTPWKGYNLFLFSLVFNSFNSLVDYAVFLILVPTTCITLKIIKIRYQSYQKK